MTKSYAIKDLALFREAGTSWVLWFFSQNACYHFDPEEQGQLALCRRFLRSEISFDGLDDSIITEGIDELIAAGVIEASKVYGSRDEFLCFSADFLNTEANLFFEDECSRSKRLTGR